MATHPAAHGPHRLAVSLGMWEVFDCDGHLMVEGTGGTREERRQRGQVVVSYLDAFLSVPPADAKQLAVAYSRVHGHGGTDSHFCPGRSIRLKHLRGDFEIAESYIGWAWPVYYVQPTQMPATCPTIGC